MKANFFSVITIVALVIATPFAIRLVGERTGFFSRANEDTQIVDASINSDNNIKTIYLTLDQMDIAYIEFATAAGSQTVISPVGGISPRFGHSFVIDTAKQGLGTVSFVVRGKKMPDKTLQVTAQ